MDRVIRQWLAKTPVLLTAYLALGNRGRRRGRREISAALALSIAWMAAVWIYVHTHRAAAVSTIAWLHRHDLFWATISAIVAGALVSRRRALLQIAASRSWIAALPVERSTDKGPLKNNLRKFLASYMISIRGKYHWHPTEIQEIITPDERAISTYVGGN